MRTKQLAQKRQRDAEAVTAVEAPKKYKAHKAAELKLKAHNAEHKAMEAEQKAKESTKAAR